MKRGWMVSREFEFPHIGKRKGIYRMSDGTLYASCVAGRLYFTGHVYEILPRKINITDA